MRRIVFDDRDLSLFENELGDSDFDYLLSHKETFKQMWQDQGKKFWVRFLISFRWYTTNRGVLAEFPGDKDVFDAIIDRAFIYMHDVFVDGKESQAQNFVLDTFILSSSKGAMKYLEAKPIAKDPFYAKDTRTVFRRLFGDPSDRRSYINVYFTLPLYIRFGGALIECVKRWINASPTNADDDTYWKPPQPRDALPTPSQTPDVKPKKVSKKKKNRSKSASSSAKKPKEDSSPRTPDGVDLDYQLYLEEMLRGSPYCPVVFDTWDYGDPRFMDPENPLYDLTADPRSDWRQSLTFAKFRAYYRYVTDRGDEEENQLPEWYKLYHPDILTYPPPVNKRIYDEIERSFLERCEKHYLRGLKVPEEKLEVDELRSHDTFEIGQLEGDGSYIYLEKEPMPHPCPNVFPTLLPHNRLMVVRRHIDNSGPYAPFTSEQIMCIFPDEVAESFDPSLEPGPPASQAETKKDAAKDSPSETPAPSQDIQPEATKTSQKKKKSIPKTKSVDVQSSTPTSTDTQTDPLPASGATQTEPDKEDTKSKAGKKSKDAKGSTSPPSASGAASMLSTEDSVTTETTDDRIWKPAKKPGPDYPTCLDEMKIVPMTDISPTVSGLFQLMALQMGDADIFHLARRKATLPYPGVRDEFTYGHVTGYTEKQTLDMMACSIQKEWRKARRKRKRERRAREEQKRLIRIEVERRREERRKERAQEEEAARAWADCQKEVLKQNTMKDGDDSPSLRRCTTCDIEEPEPHAYKKCQRCQEEKVSLPRYYCSRNCQAVDWKLKHRNEHNQNLL